MLPKQMVKASRAGEGGASGGNSGSKGRYSGGNGHERSLYVKQIPEKTAESEVREKFGKFGKVSDVAINKGYLFVTFSDVSAATAALASKEKIVLGGKSVTVEKRKADGGQKKGGSGGGGTGGVGRSSRGNRRGPGNSEDRGEPAALGAEGVREPWWFPRSQDWGGSSNSQKKQ